jgi:hypothetical protein
MAPDVVAPLRPVEKCVLRMSDAGVPDAEIGRRLHRSADHVRRVRALAHVPREHAVRPAGSPPELRPLERRVLRWLDDGVGYERVSEVFRRGPGFAEFVEEMARYKLGRQP